MNSNAILASSDILECKNILRGLYDLSKQVVLQWIAGHCSIAGNELADYLAKQDVSILQTSRNAISFNNIKLLIKKKIENFVLNQNSEMNSNKIWWNSLQSIPNWPRSRPVAEFRLATGHDGLIKHL